MFLIAQNTKVIVYIIMCERFGHTERYKSLREFEEHIALEVLFYLCKENQSTVIRVLVKEIVINLAASYNKDLV